MRVYVYPADDFGCGHYRMIWPAAEVHKISDFDVAIVTSENARIGAHLDSQGRITQVIYPQDADIVVFQRPTHRYIAAAIPLLRQRGVTVVVDMDDDLRTIHPANPAFVMLHPKNSGMHTWQNASAACREASMVTVSTEALARRYGSHGRVRVIHNTVPESFLKVEHTDSDLLGWGGSAHSHPNDLSVVGSSIARLVSEGTQFRVVGSGTDVARLMNLNDNPDETGIVRFHDWASELTQIGVGIAPLADTAFNEAKSWLKPLEYSAVGIPWVASDRTEYRRLHGLGCGSVVERPREWERELRRLLESSDLREDMSGRGREVASELTIERYAERWHDAWLAALDERLVRTEG